MKVAYKADESLTAENVKAKTGKTLEDWFALLDEQGGSAKGRRELNLYLYRTMNLDPWWATTLTHGYEEARGVHEKDGRLKGYTICSTKTIGASVAACFDAFASREALEGWFADRIDLDFAVGGKFSSGDGNRGEFKRIRPGKDIRIAWEESPEGPTVADIVFQEKGPEKCLVMITHDRIQTRAEADGLRAAWGAALDTLKSTLEKKG